MSPNDKLTEPDRDQIAALTVASVSPARFNDPFRARTIQETCVLTAAAIFSLRQIPGASASSVLSSEARLSLIASIEAAAAQSQLVLPLLIS